MRWINNWIPVTIYIANSYLIFLFFGMTTNLPLSYSNLGTSKITSNYFLVPHCPQWHQGHVRTLHFSISSSIFSTMAASKICKSHDERDKAETGCAFNQATISWTFSALHKRGHELQLYKLNIFTRFPVKYYDTGIMLVYIHKLTI